MGQIFTISKTFYHFRIELPHLPGSSISVSICFLRDFVFICFILFIIFFQIMYCVPLEAHVPTRMRFSSSTGPSGCVARYLVPRSSSDLYEKQGKTWNDSNTRAVFQKFGKPSWDFWNFMLPDKAFNFNGKNVLFLQLLPIKQFGYYPSVFFQVFQLVLKCIHATFILLMSLFEYIHESSWIDFLH